MAWQLSNLSIPPMAPDDFVRERSRVHETFIRETNRTKRLGFVSSVLMLLIGCLAFVFAPAGREIASYVVGAFLVTLAVGVGGFTVFKLKVPGVALDASSQERK